MKFVGVDLHKHTITLVVVDAARKVLARRRFSNLMSEQIVQFLKTLGEFQLTVEATASYEWFVQLVEPLASRIVLAHPGKLRVIAESTRKSDKLDAKVLAEMLALDQIPSAYRPTPRQRTIVSWCGSASFGSGRSRAFATRFGGFSVTTIGIVATCSRRRGRNGCRRSPCRTSTASASINWLVNGVTTCGSERPRNRGCANSARRVPLRNNSIVACSKRFPVWAR